MRWIAMCCVVVLTGCATVRPQEQGPEKAAGGPRAIEEIALREQWLHQRHALLLPMMRKHGVGMWIVVNEEFNDDPLTEHVAPPRIYVGNRDIFVFVDAGAEGLKRYAVTGYAEESTLAFFEAPAEPGKQKEALGELFRKHDPKTIALAMDGRRGQTRGLTFASYQFLVEAMGEAAKARFVSAAPLIEEYVDTRLPDEFPHYQRMVELTAELVRRAFSPERVKPGKTTVGELRRFLIDAAWEQRVGLWFQPDLRVQRAGMSNASSRGFLAVAKEDVVIQPGDVLHVDYGIVDLGLMTDFQRMAYVLKPGETDAPAGLKAALANTHALQDALMLRAARPGRSSADVYDAAMAEAKAKGLEAMIYSHPLGFHGHGLGPGIDFRAATRGEPAHPLRPGSYVAIELNTATPIPEWNGQKVFMMEEDPAHLTDEGYRFFVPRQEKLILLPAQ